MDRVGIIAVFLFFSVSAAAQGTPLAERVTKESVLSGGATREYFLFIPKKALRLTPGKALPLLVLLHGTGGTGRESVLRWQEFAEREDIVLAAPTGRGQYGWKVPEDGPELQRDVIESVRQKAPVDARRVYLSGYSAGADMAFFLAAAQSECYAAAVMFSGALRPRQFAMLDLPPRKMPVAYFIGELDEAYSLKEARATRDAFQKRGYKLLYRELPATGHNPFGQFEELSKAAWDFLSRRSLAAEPKCGAVGEPWLRYALK